jgi:hypothetical protein
MVPRQISEKITSTISIAWYPTTKSDGIWDNVVPPRFGQKYAEEAKKVGDDVSFVVVDNASHFEVIAPGSVAWPQVEQAVLSMMQLQKGTSK